MIYKIMIGFPLVLMMCVFSLAFMAPLAHSQLSEAQVLEKYKGANTNETLQNIQAAVNNKSLACSDVPSDIIAFNCPDTQAKLDALKTRNIANPVSTTISDAKVNADNNNPTSAIVTLIACLISGAVVIKLMKKPHRLSKFGLLFVLVSMIIMIIIFDGGMLDDNGKVGASIIDCGTLDGIAIAFLVRGSQESKFINYQKEHASSKTLPSPRALYGYSKGDDWSDRDASTLEDSIKLYERVNNDFDVYHPMYDERDEMMNSDGTKHDEGSKYSGFESDAKKGKMKTHHKVLFSFGILKEKKK